MGLRTKTALIIGSALICLVLIIYLVTSNTLLNTFERLQAEDMRKDLERVTNALEEEYRSIDRAAGELVLAPQTQELALSSNGTRGDPVFFDQALIELNINLAFITDNRGEILYRRALDLGSSGLMPFPESIGRSSQVLVNNITELGQAKGIYGLLVLPESPVIFSLRPITYPETANPAGFLAVGRFLDSNAIQKIAANGNIYHLNVYGIEAFVSQAEFAQIWPELTSGSAAYTELDRQGSIAGYTLIYDTFSTPALVAKVDKPAKIIEAGETSAVIWTLVIAGTGIIFVLGLVFLLDRLVLARILSLQRQVSRIDLSSTADTRLKWRGTDEIAGLAGTINQLLERTRRSQNDLIESENNYRRLFNSINDVVFLHLADSENNRLNCLETNQMTSRILGYSRDEILSMNNTVLIHPEDCPDFLDFLFNLPFEQKAVFDVRMITREQQIIVFEFSSQAFEFHEQTVVLSMARDITLRKQTEAELNAAYQEELSLRHALEDEIRRRAEFFKALVHELKTPLTPMLASSEAILDITRDDLLVRLATNIFRGAERLNSRVDELLDIARGEMGVLKVSLSNLDIRSLLEDAAAYMRPQFEQHEQSLILDLPEKMEAVWGDESRLRQVLVNLLSNSNKYTSHGGRITLRARTTGNYIQVEVQDNGIGIDPAQQERLFIPYNRIENDQHHYSGLGLGLALSKQIIDLHQGKIWVDSQKNTGSTFGFTIPLVSPGKSPDFAESEPQPQRMQTSSQHTGGPIG